MATALYNGYLIVSFARQDSTSNDWHLTVDISSRQAGRPSKTIHKSVGFQTKEEAEAWGVKEARAWIEKQL